MAPDAPDSRDLLSFLDFHVAAGVDAVLDETPHDRFAEPETRRAARAETEAPARRAEPAPGPDHPAFARDEAPRQEASRPEPLRRDLPPRDPPRQDARHQDAPRQDDV
jgi:DNA polymerase